MKKTLFLITLCGMAFLPMAMAGGQDYNHEDGPAKIMPPKAAWERDAAALPELAMNRHRGFFASAVFGVNVVSVKVTKKDKTRYKKGSWDGFAWNGDVGYMFNNYFGIESGLSQYGTSVFAFGAAFRGTLPIETRWNVFAKIGLTSVFTSYIPGALVLPYFGVGSSYAFTHNLEGTIQITNITFGQSIGGYDADANLGVIGVGVTYYLS